MNDIKKASLILGVSLAIGMCVSALILSTIVGNIKKSTRFVTVRGLAEREVSADLAIWPITFKVMDNNLSMLSEKFQKGRASVQQFLRAEGFDANEISNSPVQITDLQTMIHSAEEAGREAKSNFRYMGTATIVLRTTKVAQIKKTMEKCDQLVQAGVAVSADEGAIQTQFKFTNLNQIKPEMIEEANINARKAADKFAKDSSSRLGKIRYATQGLFDIEDRDSSSPDMKIVRVVTTVDYFLE